MPKCVKRRDLNVGRDRRIGRFTDFVDDDSGCIEKAHQISLMGLSKWLPREGSNLGHTGYDLTYLTTGVGLSLRPV